jgi:hypothetical protein
VHSKIFGSAAGVGVVLTGGGLDQVLGLLHLRELEPIHIFASVRSACQMGHLQVSRPDKVFVHINHTNRILAKGSPQYREVREAGWDVAEDGWECRLRQAKPTLAL